MFEESSTYDEDYNSAWEDGYEYALRELKELIEKEKEFCKKYKILRLIWDKQLLEYINSKLEEYNGTN